MGEPPPNPLGGRTLIVDSQGTTPYSRPSDALRDAGGTDQIYVRPGVYEDKVFVVDRPIHLIGAGKDAVQIFSRRGGPLYLQQVKSGRIAGITFRYVGSDQHSAMNILDSSCTVIHCRAMDGVLSGMVVYGPHSSAVIVENEVCNNRESGIFIFAGARPRVAANLCANNHHFGIAVRDSGTHPELVRNRCQGNLLSGMLFFHQAEALIADNQCVDNSHWGVVFTPDARTTPSPDACVAANVLMPNPRGPSVVTDAPLSEIGR
jgi:hypothetical protein